MDTLHYVLEVLLAVLSALIGYFVYNQSDSIKSLREDKEKIEEKYDKKVSELWEKYDELNKTQTGTQVMLAGEYVKRTELREMMTHLEGVINDRFNKLDSKLDQKADKV